MWDSFEVFLLRNVFKCLDIVESFNLEVAKQYKSRIVELEEANAKLTKLNVALQKDNEHLANRLEEMKEEIERIKVLANMTEEQRQMMLKHTDATKDLVNMTSAFRSALVGNLYCV